jgi:hypothetical protein
MDAPRVRCDECDFAWYGAESAHGLSVIGHCPHCGGSLQFLQEEPASEAPARDLFDRARSEQVAPSRVLGVPLTWS